MFGEKSRRVRRVAGIPGRSGRIRDVKQVTRCLYELSMSELRFNYWKVITGPDGKRAAGPGPAKTANEAHDGSDGNIDRGDQAELARTPDDCRLAPEWESLGR
jgi:hypothetical protein